MVSKSTGRRKKYRNYFYLRPARPDGSLPTNWQSKFGGAAWEPFGNTDLYYLHLYDKSQADLDWHNPEVRREAASILNFWRKKGVKGFRFDVINVTGKSEDLVDSTDPVQEKSLYTDTPVVHNYLKELSRKSFGQDPDIVTVGEMSSAAVQNCIEYSRPQDHELSMVFTFHHLKVDYKDGEKWSKIPFNFMKLKKIFIEWQTKMDQGGGWNALFWNNHDQPWALNRFGDPVGYREKSAELLATALHLMRGTPYIYMGEEIGMTDPHYQSIRDYVDVESRNAYREMLRKGLSASEAFELIRTKSRDNGGPHALGQQRKIRAFPTSGPGSAQPAKRRSTSGTNWTTVRFLNTTKNSLPCAKGKIWFRTGILRHCLKMIPRSLLTNVSSLKRGGKSKCSS